MSDASEGICLLRTTTRWHRIWQAPTTEKMIVKLRAGMMPPPGAARPGGDSLQALVQRLETRIDEAAAAAPDPGGRTFQRLNRAEYARSIHDLLGLEIDAGAYLPLDTKSENFDNIADVQMLSPTLLDAYLGAAAEISRLAVGDMDAAPRDRTYSVSGYSSQIERVAGAPFGTRGGTSVVHISRQMGTTCSRSFSSTPPQGMASPGNSLAASRSRFRSMVSRWL